MSNDHPKLLFPRRMEVSNPCRDCKLRHVGCHAKCGMYAAWKDMIQAVKEDQRRRRKGAALAEEHEIRSKCRSKKMREV